MKPSKNVPVPAFEVKIFKHGNFYTGDLYKDGVHVVTSGEPNSYAFVHATLEPWLATAMYAVFPEEIK